jgi:hypothetical protein
MLAHHESIEIEARFGVHLQRALFDQSLKILARTFIDSVAVNVRAFGQINFGARYMQQAQRITGGQRARLLRINHVIGHTRHLLDSLDRRAQSAERINDSHGRSFSLQLKMIGRIC